MQALTNQDLQKIAPSIFSIGATDKMSDKYRFLPTIDVVDGMRREGWQPVKAIEQRVRLDTRRGFQKHVIRFRRYEDLNSNFKVNDVFPEIVLVNSHDGSSAYQLHAGLFRLACSNGMTVSDSTFEKISVKHIGERADQVIEASYRILSAIPQIMENVETMRAISLNRSEQLAFAESALILKYDSLDLAPVRAEKVLTLRRQDDQNADLWTTLNVVQENVVRGGLKDRMKRNAKGESFRRTSAIKSIDENLKINKALWHLAESLKQMKAA